MSKKIQDTNDFKSSLELTSEEAREILKEKIEFEKNKIARDLTSEAKKYEKNILDNINYVPSKINIVSLFSGAGGLDLGATLAGLTTKYGEKKAYRLFQNKQNFWESNENINLIYSNDIFKEANKTYNQNFKSEHVQDSRSIDKVFSFPKSDLMLGGFPCPGFSSAGPRLLDDDRNFLYIHYIRALTVSQPAFFIAENVKGLLSMAKGEALSQIVEDFSNAGYQVQVELVNSKHYGVPQSRERVFIIGIRNDIHADYNFKYILPKKNTEEISLEKAISDLPLDADDVFESSYSSIYMSRNRKKSWDDVSFTIQASGRQAPQHPYGSPMKKIEKDKWIFTGEFNRRLSVRECARIQTFPDWFIFNDGDKKNVSKNNRLNTQYKQIGNAVPVLLAEKITRPLINFLETHPEVRHI